MMGDREVIELTDILCGLLRGDVDDFGMNRACEALPELARKLAANMVRIAARRIFAEPEQSVLELPTNGLDAHNELAGRRVTGKFGVGFFSILYWLFEDTPGAEKRELLINSRPRTGHDCVGIRLARSPETGALVAHRSEPRRKDFGTTVELDCSAAPLREDQVDLMRSYMLRLRFATGSHVVLDGVIINSQTAGTGTGTGALPTVGVSLRPDRLEFTDAGVGMTWRTALLSLLVAFRSSKPPPTANTTGLPESATPATGFYPPAHPDGQSRAVVVVGNVIVIDSPFRVPTGIDAADVVFGLSGNVPVPVSRDDVLHAADVVPAARVLLDKAMVGRFDSAAGVVLLQLAVRAIAQHRAAPTNALSDALDAMLAESDGLFVPLEHWFTVFASIAPTVREQTGLLINPFIGASTTGAGATVFLRWARETRSVRGHRTLAHLKAAAPGIEPVLVPEVPGLLGEPIEFGCAVLVFLDPTATGLPRAVDDKVGTCVWVTRIGTRNPHLGIDYDYETAATATDDETEEAQLLRDGGDIRVLPSEKQHPYKRFRLLSVGTATPIKSHLLPALGRLFDSADARGVWYNENDFATNYFDCGDATGSADVAAKTAGRLLFVMRAHAKTMLKRLEYLEYGRSFIKGNDQHHWDCNHHEPTPPTERIIDTMVVSHPGPAPEEAVYTCLIEDATLATNERSELVSWFGIVGKFVCDARTFTSLFATRPTNTTVSTHRAALLAGAPDMPAKFALAAYLDTVIGCARIFGKTEEVHVAAALRATMHFIRTGKAGTAADLARAWCTNNKDVHGLVQSVFLATLRSAQGVRTAPRVVPTGEELDAAGVVRATRNFSLSCVLELIFRPGVDLSTWFDHVETEQPCAPPVQALQIAVNEGSSKEPVTAVLIELFQNAIDAGSANAAISVSVSETPGGGAEIAVGNDGTMDAFNLLALSVPFLSTKTSGTQTVGEMGSGFFNVYRPPFDEVRVWSGQYHLTDRPVRNPLDNRCIDVRRAMRLTDRSEPRTVVALCINADPVGGTGEGIGAAALARKLVTGPLSVFRSIDLDGERCRDHRTVNISSARAGTSEVVLFAVVPTSSTVAVIESHVYTGDVPLREIRWLLAGADVPEWVENTLDEAAALRLGPGVYEPVQTRSRAHLKPGAIAAVRDVINGGMLRFMAELLNAGLLPDLFPHARSEQTVWQVLPTATAGTDGLVSSYRTATAFWLTAPVDAEPARPSVSQVMLRSMSACGTKPTLKDLETHVRAALPNSPAIARAIVTWFSNKSFESATKRPRPNDDVRLQPATSTGWRAEEVCLREFVNAMWESPYFFEAGAVIVPTKRDAPKFRLITDPFTGIIAYYAQAKHEIVANTAASTWPPLLAPAVLAGAETFGVALRHGDTRSKRALAEQGLGRSASERLGPHNWIGFAWDATLRHELEHAHHAATRAPGGEHSGSHDAGFVKGHEDRWMRILEQTRWAFITELHARMLAALRAEGLDRADASSAP